jgi:hypothetical protein
LSLAHVLEPLACFAVSTRKEVANLTLFFKAPSFVQRFGEAALSLVSSFSR